MISSGQKIVEITTVNPFKKDTLNRKEEVENLANLLTTISTPLVLSINSPWGTGKTTFSLMLKAFLEEKNIVCLYFNAWETDFSEDPLIAFLGEVNNEVSNILDTEEKSEVWEKTKKTGQYIAKKSLPTLIKLASGGIIDLDKDIEKEILSLAENITNDAIKSYESKKTAIKIFKDSLAEVVEKIYEDDKTPIVIFIDELDRCNPLYAINLLERIKHILNIKRIVFVLSIDKIQLIESIKNIYGAGFNSSIYIKRFIDLEYQLNQPSLDNFIENLFNNSFYNDFFSKREKYQKLRYDKPYLLGSLKFVAHGVDLSLRDIEQLSSRVYIAILTTEENQYLHPSLLVFLMVVKDIEPNIYESYIKGRDPSFNIIKTLHSLSSGSERFKSFESSLIEGLLLCSYKNSETIDTRPIIEKYEKTINNPNLEYYDDENKYSRQVLFVYNEGTGTFNDPINLSKIVNKIEMTEKFNL